jgi:DnaJ-class molecular chaperone
MIPPCERDEPVSCETCSDNGWVTQQVHDGPYGREVADVRCPDCDGQTPAYIPGHDDRVDWMFEDR